MRRDIFHHIERHKHGISVWLGYQRSRLIQFLKEEKGWVGSSSQPAFLLPSTSLFSFWLIFIAIFLSSLSNFSLFLLPLSQFTSTFILLSRLIYLLPHLSALNLLAFFFYQAAWAVKSMINTENSASLSCTTYFLGSLWPFAEKVMLFLWF